MSNFIKTQDNNAAAQLRAAHFSYINKDADGFHIFLNDGKFNFSACDKTKITFTDIISL